MASSESLIFDVLARDAASAPLLKVAASAQDAAGGVGDLNKQLTALNGRIATARVQLSGSREAQAQLDALVAKLALVGSRTITGPVGLTRTAADISAVSVSLDKLIARQTAVNALWKAGTGPLGLMGAQLKLFGGALPLAVSGTHLLADGIIETAAVLIPATAGILAFGAAAVPTVQSITNSMKALAIAEQATGQQAYPLTGAFQKMAAAVQPQVYQLFGEALVIAGHSGGALQTMATETGHALDLLGARFAAAITSGTGFTKFAHEAGADVLGLGTVVGNLGGVLGNVLKVVPGYAGYLLQFAGDATHAAEGVSALIEPLLRVGLAAHGALLYGGLLGTLFTATLSRGLPVLATGLGNLAVGLERLGPLGQKAATGVDALAGGLGQASKLNWGWIGIAVAGFGALVYVLSQSKDAAQQFNDSMQQVIQNAGIMSLQTTIMEAAGKTAEQLAGAQQQVAVATRNTAVSVGSSLEAWRVHDLVVGQAVGVVNQYAAGLRQVEIQNTLVATRLDQLEKMYGGTRGALAALNAAGITSAQITNTSNNAWAAALVQIAATQDAYRALALNSGQLGAAQNALAMASDSTAKAIQQVNTAETQLLATILGGEATFTAGVTLMRQAGAAARATGASYRGTNAASITLRQSGQALITNVQNVVGAMLANHAATSSLAHVMSTLLNPAVHAGILGNQALRNAIFEVATTAGYTGPNKLGPLSAWIARNATSLQNASAQADGYTAALNRIPRNVTTTVSILLTGAGAKAQTPFPGLASGTMGAAPGWAWTGEKGPELVRFHGGETVLSHAQSVMAARGVMLPSPPVGGYAAGTGSQYGIGDLIAAVDGVRDSVDAVLGAVGQLTGVTAAGPSATGGALAAGLNGVARGSGYAAIYSTRP